MIHDHAPGHISHPRSLEAFFHHSHAGDWAQDFAVILKAPGVSISTAGAMGVPRESVQNVNFETHLFLFLS